VNSRASDIVYLAVQLSVATAEVLREAGEEQEARQWLFPLVRYSIGRERDVRAKPPGENHYLAGV
jgi:hypothetical protein